MNAIMNELSQPVPGLGLTIFVLLMTYAAVSDLLTMRIPNWLNLATIVSAIAFGLLLPLDSVEFGSRLIWATAVFAICYCMFHLNWMGGGDVKMIPGVLLWCPSAHYVELLAGISMYGGALAFGVILVRSFPMPVFTVGWTWLDRIHTHKERKIPYGIAIAAGGITIKLMEVNGNLIS